MIKEIIKYQTDDGCIFDTFPDAEKYNVLLQACNEIEAHLMTVPEDDIDFKHGIGWIQHPKGTKIALELNILNIINKHFNSNYTKIDYTLGKIITNGELKCLNYLLNRYSFISEDDREFGYIYYASNPNKAKGGQINGSN